METLEEIIASALREDIGDGDHTTLACIPASARGKAQLLIKETGILAGVAVAREVFRQVDPDIVFTEKIGDGQAIRLGDIAFTVEGSSRSLLTAERLALNFMQRMSGIATQTRQMVDLLRGTSTRILDTRKTTPNLRLVEKMAVKIGGGENHRMGLYDQIMIKDNHIDFAGGIEQAIDATQQYLRELGKKLPVEIEVRNFEELNQVLEHGGVQRIMLDNFRPEALKEAVSRIQGRYETEASGGITLETLPTYAHCGADFISIGALTHHIHSLDMSLKAL